MLKMKKALLVLLVTLLAFPAFAVDTSGKKEDSSKAVWNRGIVTTIGFTQLSLMQWAAGGAGQLTLNTYVDAYLNMTKGKLLWNNELQAGYGFIENFETGYKKSDDRLIFDSKFGYKAAEKLYLSVVYNFRTQFADGVNSSNELVSQFMAPAYTSLGLGIDYSPIKNLSINIAPVTGKVTMVKTPELRTRYGNAEDQFARFELGAQVKFDGKVEVKDFKVSTQVVLFSDYLNKPQNIKVNWDLSADAKISQYFSVNLRTNLIYDDNTLVPKVKYVDHEKIEYDGKGIQLKEMFTIGLTYTFGEKKK